MTWTACQQSQSGLQLYFTGYCRQRPQQCLDLSACSLCHAAQIWCALLQSSSCATQHAEEAGDNLKFLSTLERHFKAIELGPLEGVADVLPPLMGALRLVWVISRHYSQDAHMASLMQRIAVVLGNCIEASIDLQVRHTCLSGIGITL